MYCFVITDAIKVVQYSKSPPKMLVVTVASNYFPFFFYYHIIVLLNNWHEWWSLFFFLHTSSQIKEQRTNTSAATCQELGMSIECVECKCMIVWFFFLNTKHQTL